MSHAGVLLLHAAVAVVCAQPLVASTVFGSGAAGAAGDGGAGTSAQLSAPAGVALTPAGALYVADSGNNAVRLLSVTGVASTVAGAGVTRPLGVGVGGVFASGQAVPGTVLYIADTNGNRIRSVPSASGIASTSAGNGTSGFNGCSVATPAAAAMMNMPASVAADFRGEGNAIADAGNHVVYGYFANGGSPDIQLSTPSATGTRHSSTVGRCSAREYFSKRCTDTLAARTSLDVSGDRWNWHIGLQRRWHRCKVPARVPVGRRAGAVG